VASNFELKLLHFLPCCLHIHSASLTLFGKNSSVRPYSLQVVMRSHDILFLIL
jgi:hypothetical protein